MYDVMKAIGRFAAHLFIFTSSIGTTFSNSSLKRPPELKVSIGLYDSGLVGYPLNKKRLEAAGADRRLPILIENVSRHPLDLYVDGTSWGDPALTFYLTLSDGRIFKIKKVVGGYTANAAFVVRLLPGQIWCREIAYNSLFWSGFADVFKLVLSQPYSRPGMDLVKLRVDLEQTRDLMGDKDPNLWIGRVTSSEIVAEVSPF